MSDKIAGRCGYTIIDTDGDEQPCDRAATGWRWYQDCDHEDALDVACDLHANEGGRRIHELGAEVVRLESDNTRLREEVEQKRGGQIGYFAAAMQLQAERDEARAERDSLAAKVARVEALCAKAAPCRVVPDCDDHRLVTVADLRRALAAQPDPGPVPQHPMGGCNPHGVYCQHDTPAAALPDEGEQR